MAATNSKAHFPHLFRIMIRSGKLMYNPMITGMNQRGGFHVRHAGRKFWVNVGNATRHRQENCSRTAVYRYEPAIPMTKENRTKIQ
jgi:hypothetical protein